MHLAALQVQGHGEHAAYALCVPLIIASACAGMRMLEKYGVAANELRVVGGGSKNRLWRRIIADAFQLPLRFPAEPESAALGGALQAAAVCAGVPVAEYVAENEPPCEEEVRSPPCLAYLQYACQPT